MKKTSQLLTCATLLLLSACSSAPKGQITMCPPPPRLPELSPLPAAAEIDFSEKMQKFLSGLLPQPIPSEPR